MSRSNDRGFIVLVLFVYLLSTLTFPIWTVRDRDFLSGMHTPLMVPFQMTQRSRTLKLTFVFKIAFWTVAARDKVSHKRIFFIMKIIHTTKMVLRKRYIASPDVHGCFACEFQYFTTVRVYGSFVNLSSRWSICPMFSQMKLPCMSDEAIPFTYTILD